MNEARAFQKPTEWDQLYPGRFLKAGDLAGKKVTLTIAAIDLDELEGNTGKKVKGVISFEKTDKQLALNKTNGICLKEMFGKKVQEWVGRRVTLFSSSWNGEDCIRIWGSPELTEDREITIQLPRKRPMEMTMHKVDGPRAATAGASSKEPA
jgi:hypothetical protein